MEMQSFQASTGIRLHCEPLSVLAVSSEMALEICSILISQVWENVQHMQVALKPCYCSMISLSTKFQLEAGGVDVAFLVINSHLLC